MQTPHLFPHARSLAATVFALLVLTLAACDSEDPVVIDGNPLTDIVAAVNIDGDDARIVNDVFPSGSGTAPTVSGGDEIVRGGSILLRVQLPTGAERLLVGLEGDYGGYFEADVSSSTASLIVTSESDTEVGVFTLLVAAEVDGDISTAARLPVTVNTQAGSSDLLQVSLNWDAPVDLDLHLETPEGEDIYYGNTTTEMGGMLDLDSNAGCSLDRVDNENISWGDDTPPSGEYIVRVDLWSACDYDETIPFVVTVNNRGELETFTGSFEPDDADQGGAFDGRTITEFTF